MHGRVKRTAALIAAGALVATAGACGDDGDSGDDGGYDDATTRSTEASPLAGGAEGAVLVTLREFQVVSTPPAVDAGPVTFSVRNAGPDEEHEFLIIKSNLEPEELPYLEDGSVSEDDVDVVDEIEPLDVGDTEELTVDLESGSYVLICNIVAEEDDLPLSHYANGMSASFDVR